ncbi:5-hydroxytryptamine receptor 1-like [Paramuricea clavata]|uniref:5-hydroxytryptamine receptor 1-like n=1 Tax=Paramuricea clavata TaxID=317549 RepID=A0A6S7HAF7_PARCT|nr:5-hydroxytryptamine receptor 1-like [Paramuricea clavata]
MAMDHCEIYDFHEIIDHLSVKVRVILILIIIFAILGNTLVLIATWKEKNLHEPNKYFVACLAVADLLVGMILVPLRLYQLVNKENGGITSIHLCRFYIWLDVFLGTSSIYALTFVSFDRYLKISKPLQYKSRMTISTSLKIVFIIWLIAATYATLAMFPYADSPGIVISTGGCFSINKIFYTFAAVSAFFLPTTIMLVMYTLISLVARKQQKILRNGELSQTYDKPNQRSALLQDLKVIHMLFVVVGVFLFCWVTNYYNPSLLFFTSWTLSDLYLITILHRLVDTSPFACLHQKYKEAFKHLFQRMMCRPSSRRREPPQ